MWVLALQEGFLNWRNFGGLQMYLDQYNPYGYLEIKNLIILIIFSRKSDSRDSIVRSLIRSIVCSFVRPSSYFKSVVNQEFFKRYESRIFQALWITSFSSIMNQASLKR